MSVQFGAILRSQIRRALGVDGVESVSLTFFWSKVLNSLERENTCAV